MPTIRDLRTVQGVTYVYFIEDGKMRSARLDQFLARTFKVRR